ncbi:MAG: hypothetical protein Q9163_004222 [Psora crenata]
MRTNAQLRLLYTTLQTPRPAKHKFNEPNTSTHLLIVLGSGGHTAEMLAMLHELDPSRYTHRTYLFSSGDSMSATRALAFEANLANRTADTRGGEIVNGNTEASLGTEASDKWTGNKGREKKEEEGQTWCIHQVPRARQIHQSLLTTPFSCFSCLLACLQLLRRHPKGWGYPDLVLVNGPATSLILVLATLLVRYFSFLDVNSAWRSIGGELEGQRRQQQQQRMTKKTKKKKMDRGKLRTIYVESWARVKTPSLSLKIIHWGGLCDRVLVQWEPLARQGWGEYRGDLMR